MSDSWNEPGTKAWIADVHERLIPMIEGSTATVSICPTDPEDIDIKFSVELGISIMLDKPIITVVRPGTRLPEHLVRVSDRIIEMDLENDSGKVAEAISQAVNELAS